MYKLIANEFVPTPGCSRPPGGAALAAIDLQRSGHLHGYGVTGVLDAVLFVEVDQRRLEYRGLLL